MESITALSSENFRAWWSARHDEVFVGRGLADEEVCVVGGDTAFMQQVIDGAGGEIALREAFMHCADYLLKFSRPTAEFVERLQSLAGWRRAS